MQCQTRGYTPTSRARSKHPSAGSPPGQRKHTKHARHKQPQLPQQNLKPPPRRRARSTAFAREATTQGGSRGGLTWGARVGGHDTRARVRSCCPRQQVAIHISHTSMSLPTSSSLCSSRPLPPAAPAAPATGRRPPRRVDHARRRPRCSQYVLQRLRGASVPSLHTRHSFGTFASFALLGSCWRSGPV